MNYEIYKKFYNTDATSRTTPVRKSRNTRQHPQTSSADSLPVKRKLYIVGSLRNKSIPKIANTIRQSLPRIEVFDDWFAAGPEADDYWREYSVNRGDCPITALDGFAAKNVFNFDKSFLDKSTHVLLVCPAGKSGHLEAGYAVGSGKIVSVLMEQENKRWDVMYSFFSSLHFDVKEYIDFIRKDTNA